jgi:hypothetical protein
MYENMPAERKSTKKIGAAVLARKVLPDADSVFVQFSNAIFEK